METTGAAIGIDTAFGSVAPAPVAVRVVGLRRLRSRRLVAVNADTRVAVVRSAAASEPECGSDRQ